MLLASTGLSGAGCTAVDSEQAATAEASARALAEERAVPPSHCRDDEDPFEPNDTADEALTLPFDRVWTSPEWGGDASFYKSLYLCNANEDWFRIPASTLSLPPGDEPVGDGYALQLRFTVNGAGICRNAEDCGDLVLPPSKKNTVTVELYSAATGQHLGAITDPQGVISLDGVGTMYTEDFLIRIHAPAPARFDYDLSILLKSYDGEDECEC